LTRGQESLCGLLLGRRRATVSSSNIFLLVFKHILIISPALTWLCAPPIICMRANSFRLSFAASSEAKVNAERQLTGELHTKQKYFRRAIIARQMFSLAVYKKKNYRSPVLTSLNVTLLWVLSASLRLGWTKSFSAPLDDAAILGTAGLGLNPRHAKIRRFGFVGSGRGERKRRVNNTKSPRAAGFRINQNNELCANKNISN
jgi:hypothetical protein